MDALLKAFPLMFLKKWFKCEYKLEIENRHLGDCVGSGLAIYVLIQDGLISASLFLDFQTLVKYVLVNMSILEKKNQ